MSNLSKRVVKGFTVLTAVATILSLSGFAVLAPNWANAAVPSDYGLREGDVISAAGSDDPDVYIVNEQGFKRLFLNPVIFGFYGHLGGFASVKNVSPATRDAFPTSGLFRNCETGDQKVYGVETTGEDTGVLHWVNTSGAQAVADDPNFFSKVFCINTNEFNWYAKGSDYTSVNQVPNYSRAPGAQPGVGLSASLASDNPVSGTLIAEQALADLAHFQVNGSGLVTSVELKRLGVSGDTTLSNVYLFVNGARVSDAGNVSSGMITFNNGNGLFSAPAVLSVKSDILAGTSGQTVGVQLTKVNSTSVSASGNLHTIAAKPSTFTTNSIAASTGPGAFDPQNDVNVWQAVFTIGSNEAYFKRLTVREIGSVDNKDVKNLRLFVDGTQVASDMDLDADGYATFLMNHRMLTGNRTVKVMADVVGGSSRTMQFSLRGAYDVEVTDEDYNVNIKSTGTFANEPAASTIGSASVSGIKSGDSPSGDLVKEANDAVLGRFTLTAFGEAIKVETLTVLATTSDTAVGSLRNGRLLINGAQYGSTSTLDTTPSSTGTAFTVNYTIQPGSSATVEVRADMFDNDGTNDLGASDTVKVSLKVGSSNGQGVSSATQINVPSATQDANTLTVREGSATLAKYTAYANQNVVVPASSLKLGHYVLTGGSAEDITVNTVNVGFNPGDQWTAARLSNVSVKVMNSSGGLVLQTSPKSTVASTASSSYSVNFTLPKSTSYHVEVWGSVSSFTVASADDTMATDLSVSGTSAQSSGTVTTSVVAGQTMTAAAGSIASAVSGAAPSAKVVVGGSTSTVHAVDFTATNDNFTIYEMVVDMDNGTAAAAVVANVIVKDGSTVVASAPLSGASVSFTGLNISVPNNTTKTLTYDLQFGNVGVGAASTALNAKLNVESFKARDSVGTITTDANERSGNAIYVHKSYPSVSAVALPTTVLTAGEKTLSKFNLSANADTVGIKKITWDVTKSAGTVVASGSTNSKLFIDGSDVSSLGTFTLTADGAATSGTIIFEFTTEYQISSGTSKLFELKNTIDSVGASNSIVTALKVGDTAAATPNTYALTTGKLIWTDRSASSHSQTTADWINDNLLKDSTSQAMSN